MKPAPGDAEVIRHLMQQQNAVRNTDQVPPVIGEVCWTVVQEV